MRKGLLAIVLTLLCTTAFHAGVKAGEPPCQDTVRAVAVESTILVYHDQAEWNCCAEILYDLVQVQNTFNLYEIETLPSGPCDCICCFDLKTTITDVAPGLYLIRVLHWHTGEVFGEVWLVVEEGGWGTASLGETEQSSCGGWLIGVEQPSSSTWGRIKALYR